MVKRKREEPSDTGQNRSDLSLRVLDSTFTKHPRAQVEFPKTLSVSAPTKDQWMSFSNMFYPIGLVDSSGSLVFVSAEVKESVRLMPTSNEESINDPEFEVNTKADKAIYWFSSIRCHVAGKLRVTFSAPSLPLVKPLVLKIDVKDDDNKLNATKSTGKNAVRNIRQQKSSASEKSDIVHFKMTNLGSKTRINRLTESFIIRGPFKLVLPPALVCALFDDRELMQRGDAPTEVTPHPTAYYILQEAIVKLGNTPNLVELGKCLVSLFDHLLDDVILYTEERTHLRATGILQKRNSRSSGGSSNRPQGMLTKFGAVHLLRFLVVIAHGFNGESSPTDPVDEETEVLLERESSQSNVSQSVSEVNLDNISPPEEAAGEGNTNESADSTTVRVRGQGKDRGNKSISSDKEMQESPPNDLVALVNAIVEELNENSHIYFNDFCTPMEPGAKVEYDKEEFKGTLVVLE